MKLIYLKDVLKLAMKYIKGGIFFNYTIYNKFDQNHESRIVWKLKSNSRIAIVVQGPLISQDNFTVTTLKLYRSNFPDAIIIFSTWKISDMVVHELEKNAILVVQNKIPIKPGLFNINLQIVTSKAGIINAQKLGADYVLKTRSDQRIYHPNLDLYLLSILNAFPLKSKNLQQTDRLIGISLDTQKLRLYGVSDMFLFGRTSDMIKYWDTKIDNREKLDSNLNIESLTFLEFSKLRVGPVYLNTEFLKKMGHRCEWTLKDSFSVLRNRFVIIDQSAIKLLWHKYTINTDRYTQFDLFDPEIGFNDWLMMYSYMDQIKINDNAIENVTLKAGNNDQHSNSNGWSG